MLQILNESPADHFGMTIRFGSTIRISINVVDHVLDHVHPHHHHCRSRDTERIVMSMTTDAILVDDWILEDDKDGTSGTKGREGGEMFTRKQGGKLLFIFPEKVLLYMHTFGRIVSVKHVH